MVVETNQEKGGHTGDFPKYKKHHEVVRENQSDHGPHKNSQVGKKVGLSLILGHVKGCVKQDECSDASYEQTKNEAESVDAKGKIHSRQEIDGGLEKGAFTGSQLQQLQQQYNKKRKRNDGQKQACFFSGQFIDQRRGKTCQKYKGNQ